MAIYINNKSVTGIYYNNAAISTVRYNNEVKWSSNPTVWKSVFRWLYKYIWKYKR